MVIRQVPVLTRRSGVPVDSSTHGLLQHASLERCDIHGHRHELSGCHKSGDSHHKGDEHHRKSDDSYHELDEHSSYHNRDGKYHGLDGHSGYHNHDGKFHGLDGYSGYHNRDDKYRELCERSSCPAQNGCCLGCMCSVHVQDRGEVLERLKLPCSNLHGELGGAKYMLEYVVGSSLPLGSGELA